MDSHNDQRDLLQQLARKSKEDFIKEYVSYEEASARNLCFSIFTELNNAIKFNNIDYLNELRKLIANINNANKKITLQTYYNDSGNILKHTNLVILACKYDSETSLQYLFNNYVLLNNIHSAISPCDQDEECHNAFYYAIRLRSVKILEILIDKWPGVNSEKLDEVISQAYEELKLKNVALSNEMEAFVEDALINLRYYSQNSNIVNKFEVTVGIIQERINLVLDNINLLYSEYFDVELDEKFLYIATFIAKNIYVLKRHLGSTYDRLPWEEIEFCLVYFVKSCTSQEEINLLYKSVLKKENLLNHLRTFSFILKGINIENANVYHLGNLGKLRTVPRDDIIIIIVQNYPSFKELYDNYSEIIDVYSLNQINYYTALAVSADSSQDEEKLIIIRALQIIGECTKNTLESPKLSISTCELLLQSLQNDTREIVKNLRNSLSKPDSLQRRAEIEANVSFFTNVQKDIKKIHITVTEILYNLKVKRIRTLLKSTINSSSLNEIMETVVLFKHINFDGMISTSTTSENYSKLVELIDNLSKQIRAKTDYEIKVFEKINEIIEVENTKLRDIQENYNHGLKLLNMYSYKEFNNIDNNDIWTIKYYCKQALQLMSDTFELHHFKNITKLLRSIVKSRLKANNLSFENVSTRIEDNAELLILLNDVIHNIEFEIVNIKWIAELKDKLIHCKGKCNDIESDSPQKQDNSSKKHEEQLTLKLCLLEQILINRSGKSYDRKAQTILEMLLIDVIPSMKNCLKDVHYLDSNLPLLAGYNLRNFLAHGNSLIDILSLNPTTAILSNAAKLTQNKQIQIVKNTTKSVTYNLQKLKELHEQNLLKITIQQNMFTAITEDNLEEAKICIQKGADVRARTVNLWTALHFAVQGSNMKIVKFFLDQKLNVESKDINQRSALHIASIYGNITFIEFVLQNQKILIDDTDIEGKTLLHHAAQNGHQDIIELLYKKNASTSIRDKSQYYAILNAHLDAANILLMYEQNVDITAYRGFTSLHLAASKGHIKIVNMLLEKNANVNTKNDDGLTALHEAAYKGNLDVVQSLFLKGSRINSRNEAGYTPLHAAVKSNNEKLVKMLIKNGADVNASDKVFQDSPLSEAVKFGHEQIVKILLDNNANINMKPLKDKRSSPVILAASNGHLSILIRLLNKLINIEEYYHALFLSTYYGHIEIVKYLLEKKLDLTVRDQHNRTLLHVAALKGHLKVIENLLLKGVNINSIDAESSTALHLCSAAGHADIVKLLIEKGAEINIKNKFKFTPIEEAIANNFSGVVNILIDAGANINTPLNYSAFFGSKNVVEILLNKGFDINSKSEDNTTPLHESVFNNQIEVAKLLIQRGCDIDAKSNENFTPLCLAVKNNMKEIVDILLKKGADINVERGRPLHLAISAGHKNIVKTLLKNKKINFKLTNIENWTFLHAATKHGDKSTVEILLKEIDVNSKTTDNITPLLIAVSENHLEILKILLSNKADVNVISRQGDTSLHWAVGIGTMDIVKLLLDAGANADIKDEKSRLPIELAVENGLLSVVKLLLSYTNLDIAGNDGCTMLHKSIEKDNVEIAKYLVESGVDINAKNNHGLKPIHIAAREGSKKILDFLFDNANSLNDYGSASQNLLHYAAIGGQSEIVQYLIDKKFNVNFPDMNGSSALHLAASGGFQEVVKILLNNGASYKNVDSFNKKPVESASDRDVIELLTTSENLYEAVKNDNLLEVETNIKAGAVVNVKDSDDMVPLHHATCKGYKNVVNILLKYQANINLPDKNGWTPLHYAANLGDVGIVRTLLSHGAIYDLKNDKNKIPLDLAKDEDIINLLELVAESFKNVQNGNSKVINDLNKVNDIDTVKAVMNACNKENQTIVVAAIYYNFPKISQLKEVFQDHEISELFETAANMRAKEKFQDALKIYKTILEKRRTVLGPDDPAILDIQYIIAMTLDQKQEFKNAFELFKEIYDKRKKILGENNKDTLEVRCDMGVVLQELGKQEEALTVLEEVSKKQSDIFGPKAFEFLETQAHLAVTLYLLERFDEALKINYYVYETYKEIYNWMIHPYFIDVQNNIAAILTIQGNHEEAFKMFKNVYEARITMFGQTHSYTLRALNNMIEVLIKQEKYDEASNEFKKFYDLQESILGPDHIDIVQTQNHFAKLLIEQGKYTAALKILKESVQCSEAIVGPNHHYTVSARKMINAIKKVFRFGGPTSLEIFEYHLKSDINEHASNGNNDVIKCLTSDDVNIRDSEGRTPLHFATSNKHIDTVLILLERGADVTCTTNKGNTPLHIATSKGSIDIIKLLLNHVKQANSTKLISFLDTRTSSAGSTALHIAVEKNYEDIVNILLEYGATYNVIDNNNKTPCDSSTNKNLTILFKLINDFFEDAKNGYNNLICKLQLMNRDYYIAITNARNNQGNTLLEVAMINKHTDIADKLTELLNKNDL